MRIAILLLGLSTVAAASGAHAAAAAAVKAKKGQQKSKHKAKPPEPEEKIDEKAPDEKAEKAEEPQIHCKVGVYMLDVSGVDMKESVFTVDFYLWMTWKSKA